ncbi:hypothetical protein [Alkaliphilus oremlandii]|uniref:CopZ zinc binding domain-containing protein n=1 Tax=Alkaliphilus oremlandii (strain OhILAs) TaxID=350688 RepID=A8MIL9_ALKOO|nr:hypothetical protein [Alkaliphilus oremlandii]ABW19651.1 hypothetical protein Clos_2115 [Alkaliphilus oremlandii OhILAs]
MECCSGKKNIGRSAENCPLCNKLGNNIHYLAVEIVVKEELLSEVTKEAYFVCNNRDCEAVFYNRIKDRIFLVQDINLSANFDEIIKPEADGKSCAGKCGKCKETQN